MITRSFGFYILLALALGLLMVLVVIPAIFPPSPIEFSLPTATPSITPPPVPPPATFTPTFTFTPTASSTPTATSTPPPTATETPTPTTTPTATENPCPQPWGWVPYTLKEGETLTTISDTYVVWLSQLLYWNCLDEDVAPGTSLYLPAYIVRAINATQTALPPAELIATPTP